MIKSHSPWDFIRDAFGRLEHRVSRLEQVEIPFPQRITVGTYGQARNLTLTTDWQNILDFSSSISMPYGIYLWTVNFVFRSSAADVGALAEGAISVNGVLQPIQAVVSLSAINDAYVTVSQSWIAYGDTVSITMYARKSGGSGNSNLDARTTFSAIGERYRHEDE